jgi:hypothetical protein
MNSRALATLADIAESFTTRKRHLPVASSASRAEVQRFLAEQFPLNRPNSLDTLVRSASILFERWEEHSNTPRHLAAC